MRRAVAATDARASAVGPSGCNGSVGDVIEVFFCDPHAPWQRGCDENTKGLLRQYFPKGIDFATVTMAELDAVADELNDRPRKRFAFATPTELLLQ